MSTNQKTPVRVTPYKRDLKSRSSWQKSYSVVQPMGFIPHTVWINGEVISIPEYSGMTLEGSYRVLEHVKVTP